MLVLPTIAQRLSTAEGMLTKTPPPCVPSWTELPAIRQSSRSAVAPVNPRYTPPPSRAKLPFTTQRRIVGAPHTPPPSPEPPPGTLLVMRQSSSTGLPLTPAPCVIDERFPVIRQ